LTCVVPTLQTTETTGVVMRRPRPESNDVQLTKPKPTSKPDRLRVPPAAAREKAGRCSTTDVKLSIAQFAIYLL